MLSNSDHPPLSFGDIIERSRYLVQTAAERKAEIQQQLLKAQQQLSLARELLARSGEQQANLFLRLPATDVSELKTEAAGATRRFEAVTALIEQVERSATADGGITRRLIEDIMLALASGSDANLLIGVLLQGIIQTVQERMPAAEQRDTAIVLCGMLWDRISNEAS